MLLAETGDWKVTNFDALTYAGNLDNLEDLDQTRHRFVRGNIADSAAVLAALSENTHAIVNFAAESHVDRSIANAAEFLVALQQVPSFAAEAVTSATASSTMRPRRSPLRAAPPRVPP